MTPHATNRLSLVTDMNESENTGDDASNPIAPIEIDPDAVSELEFRLRVSVRIVSLEKELERTRRTVNRILTRFAIDGRPIPAEEKIA